MPSNWISNDKLTKMSKPIDCYVEETAEGLIFYSKDINDHWNTFTDNLEELEEDHMWDPNDDCNLHTKLGWIINDLIGNDGPSSVYYCSYDEDRTDKLVKELAKIGYPEILVVTKEEFDKMLKQVA